MKLRRIHILVVLLIAFAASALYLGTQAAIPSHSLTAAHIRRIRTQIVEYYRQNGKLPANLSFLAELDPPVKGTDAWGRPIIYRQVSQDKAVLVSLGADGCPGGKGQDMDISVDFSVSPATSQSRGF